MKINGNAPGNITKLYQSNQTQTETAKKKDGANAVEGDSVKLSDQAVKINELMQKTNELPEVREEKIARIKAELNHNTYHVSAQQLAAKMLSAEDE
ncbi:MAG TPA: flagellar biosynthesis anti-sigma factor FlgM [Syntrophomonas sp.]|nr:flagellar biosynthesis anti-sigma factor FlgM [Syntrophomonas sp.]